MNFDDRDIVLLEECMLGHQDNHLQVTERSKGVQYDIGGHSDNIVIKSLHSIIEHA